MPDHVQFTFERVHIVLDAKGEKKEEAVILHVLERPDADGRSPVSEAGSWIMQQKPEELRTLGDSVSRFNDIAILIIIGASEAVLGTLIRNIRFLPGSIAVEDGYGPEYIFICNTHPLHPLGSVIAKNRIRRIPPSNP
jgi:hypothetical protein